MSSRRAALVLALSCWAGLSACASSTGSRHAGAVAFRAYEVTDGRLMTIGSYRGRVVLVTVINTWANPALFEAPRLKRLALDHNPKKFSVLCIALDDSRDTARIFKETFELPYPVLMVEDRAHFTGERGPFGPIQIVPTSFLLDSDGKVVGRVEGTWPAEVLEKAVQTLLAADR